MAETRDLIPELLIAIRDEMRGMREEQRGTREELRGTREELRGTNERLERLEEQQAGTNERLDRVEKRQTESDLRLSTAIVELQHATEQNTAAIRALGVTVGELRDETRTLHDRIDHVLIGPVGAKVRELDLRVTALEGRQAGH